MGELFRFAIPPWQLALRTPALSMGLLVALRLTGKRQVGQFTLYDLVLVLLVANAVQPAMTGPDTSLAGGLAILVTLGPPNFPTPWLHPSAPLPRQFPPGPAVIIRDGRYLTDRMWREGVSEDEADTAIREHGLEGVSA